MAFVQGLNESREWPADYDSTQGPAFAKAIPWLKHNVWDMEELMQGDTPLLRRVQGKKMAKVLYRFGDASKATFGATIQIEDEILYQYGQWSSKIVENSFSNRKEDD